MRAFGPEIGGLLSLPAAALTIAGMILVAYVHGCVERFVKRSRDHLTD
jgi:hypothetical protein